MIVIYENVTQLSIWFQAFNIQIKIVLMFKYQEVHLQSLYRESWTIFHPDLYEIHVTGLLACVVPNMILLFCNRIFDASNKLTNFWLMYKVRFAGGRVASELQLIDNLSPIKYLRFKKNFQSHQSFSSRHLFWAPSILGPFWGTTTTRRSPYLLSVANIGPSSLTSHR